MAKQNKRDSWWIAYILDRDEDERARGKTVECGKAHFKTEHGRYTIIDAPGHNEYVCNMIEGAMMADIALLIVSARSGEFEDGFDKDGQTTEHAMIALKLGVKRVIVVVNKMDTIKWNKERYEVIKNKMSKFLTKIIGFKAKYISFLPCSGLNGINVAKKVNKKVCDWYLGKPLLEELDCLKSIKRSVHDKPLRITISDRYKANGRIQCIGLIRSGMVKVGQSVKIMPSNVVTKVAALKVDDDSKEFVDYLEAGENVLICFDGNMKLKDVYRGCVLCPMDAETPVCNEFVAEVYVHQIPKNGVITKGYKAMFHCHSLCVGCEVIGIKKTKKVKGPFLRTKDVAFVKMRINEKYPLEKYDDCKALARFIVRNENKTVMIGRIQSLIGTNGAKTKII